MNRCLYKGFYTNKTLKFTHCDTANNNKWYNTIYRNSKGSRLYLRENSCSNGNCILCKLERRNKKDSRKKSRIETKNNITRHYNV